MKDTRRARSVLDMGAGVNSGWLYVEGSFSVFSWSVGIVGAACLCISLSVGSKLGTSSRWSSFFIRSTSSGVRAWGRASLRGVHLLLPVFPRELMLGFSTLGKAMGLSSLMTFVGLPLNSFLRAAGISRTILDPYPTSSLVFALMAGRIIYLLTLIVLFFEGERLELEKSVFYWLFVGSIASLEKGF